MHKLPIADKNPHVRIAPAQGVEKHEITPRQPPAPHRAAGLRPLRRGARQRLAGNAAHGVLNQAAAIKAALGRVTAIGVGGVDDQQGAGQERLALRGGQAQALRTGRRGGCRRGGPRRAALGRGAGTAGQQQQGRSGQTAQVTACLAACGGSEWIQWLHGDNYGHGGIQEK